MKTTKTLLKCSAILFLLAGVLYSTSCDSTKETVKKLPEVVKDVAKETLLLAPESERQFYHAWLADCVNDITKEESFFNRKEDATEYFKKTATDRINGATKDAIIKGRMGEEELVWGPELEVELDGSHYLASYYIVKNLMYCVKSTVNGKVNYSVGIAGTNMISPYDWFKEDFKVDSVVTSVIGGKISKGAYTGMITLGNFTDGKNKLDDFLKNELLSNPTATITVSGHSLGGALTQVYSAFLYRNLSGNLKTPIQAYVYAGPTAGDNIFANALTNSVNYYAYNNSYDVVPHAWQKDSLEKICSIYNSKSFCGKAIQKSSVVNAMGNYFLGSSNKTAYTIPGKPITFKGTLQPFGACSYLNDFIKKLPTYGGYTNLYYHLNKINSLCHTGSKISEEQLTAYFYFLAEMGEQHTTAYTNHFFSNPVNTAVSKYVPGAIHWYEKGYNLEDGVGILETLLAKVQGYVQSGGNCKCQN